MCQEVKKCNACFEMKPVSEFYFRKDSNTYKGRCKRCCIDGKNMVKSKTHKVCKHCKEKKPFIEYQKAGGGKWYQPYCKVCDSLRKKTWHEDNKDRLKEKSKTYYQKVGKYKYTPHPRKLKTREEIRVSRLAYSRLPHVKQKKSVADKLYREKNIDKILEKKKKYQESGRATEMAKKWQVIKTRTDPQYKIKKNMRTRIRFALKRGAAYKSDSTINLLGCTVPFYIEYFQSLFTDGMTWEKFLSGEIVIDHVKPCKLFDLTKESEQRECFNYKNTQPLWMMDNLKKGTKYDD